MRTLLIAALAVSSFPSPDAEACGGYLAEPRVFLMSNHGTPTRHGGWQTRMFVPLGGQAPANTIWRRLAPGTYDYARIANAPAFDQAMTMTLVGPSGTRVVSSKTRWFLDSWDPSKSGSVLEVPVTREENFTVALAGSHDKAAWIALDSGAATRDDAAWVIAQGVTPSDPAYVDVSNLHGTDYELVSVYPKGNLQPVTFVRDRGQSLSRLDGSVLGGLTLRGATYVLVERDGAVTPVSL